MLPRSSVLHALRLPSRRQFRQASTSAFACLQSALQVYLHLRSQYPVRRLRLHRPSRSFVASLCSVSIADQKIMDESRVLCSYDVWQCAATLDGIAFTWFLSTEVNNCGPTMGEMPALAEASMGNSKLYCMHSHLQAYVQRQVIASAISAAFDVGLQPPLSAQSRRRESRTPM